jgi:hypothetical protein
MNIVRFSRLRWSGLQPASFTLLALCFAGIAFGQPTPPAPPAPPVAPTPPRPGVNGSDLGRQIRDQVRQATEAAREISRSASRYNGSDNYRAGQSDIDRRDYDGAIRRFDRVIDSKGERADGAMYWKAYSLHKLGRRADAQTVLADLEKQFPQSRWLNDARALGAEVRASNGQPASPESESDEELKLLAMNSLMQQDPDRAVPLLEKVLAEAKNPPNLKSRAIFVLAQSKSPRAKQIVMQYAKGGGNPDVQLRALDYLATFRTDDAIQALADVYGTTNDSSVKQAVLRGLMMGQAKDKLVQVARSEKDAKLRAEAIRYLGTMQAETELVAMYKTESDMEVKRSIISSLMSHQAAKQLVELAKAEPNAELKRDIVRNLTMIKSKEAADYLADLIGK